MLKMFKNPNGNIALAMLLVVFGAMSGFTLSSLAMRDAVAFQYDFESVQSMILLRSESFRGQRIAQRLGNIMVPVRTSVRYVPVTNSALKKTFVIQSQLSRGGLVAVDSDVVMGDQKQITQIRSLVKSKTGTGPSVFYSPKFSLIRKYGVYTLESETFAKFMYFTDTDESTNETPVYFYGPDLIYGRVHSNSDIWIKQAGGGSNGGWPTFYGWVTTAGEIQSFSGSYSEQQIFRGGLAEGYPHTIFPEHATTLKTNADRVGPNNDPNLIMMVVVNGSSYSAYLGTIQPPAVDTCGVYNPFPPYNPNTLQYTNRYAVRDTIWSTQPSGTAHNKSKWVDNKLWLMGTFGTYQTWGCADTLWLIGDILLAGTQRGASPLSNPTDVVGLVSEKSIVVKYGYRDPIDSLRYHRNCGPDNNFGGIWIYAAMAALGDGHGNSHADGVFSFEYQHPHPSVPDVIFNNHLYTRIDLHRRRFPPTGANPWPPLIDFPWYNPLWPERRPYLERGFISVYGSISQRRRGFVHRSYNDSEYPSNGVWDQPIDFCGGSSSPYDVGHNDPVLGFQLITRHFDGANGTGTGYKKNYHYDDRFYHTSPIDFPEVSRYNETPYTALHWVIKRPPENL